MDPKLASQTVVDLVGGPAGARHPAGPPRDQRARPEDPLSYFKACLGRLVPAQVRGPRRGVPGLGSREDPYA